MRWRGGSGSSEVAVTTFVPARKQISTSGKATATPSAPTSIEPTTAAPNQPELLYSL